MKLSFLDNNSLPYFLVDAFFKHGTSRLETFNEAVKNNILYKHRLWDYKEETYGKEFVDVYRSVPKTTVSMNMMEFLSLKEGQWIENNVVEIYLVLLNSKELELSKIYSERRKNYFLSSFFLQTIQVKSFNFENDFQVKINYTEFHTLFLPISDNCHWILLEILNDKNEIKVYDSKYTWSSKKQKHGLQIEESPSSKFVTECLITIEKWLNYEHKQEIVWTKTMGVCAEQKNLCDCGVFMFTAAIFLCEGLHHCINNRLYSNAIPLARFKIAIDIYQGFISDFRIDNPCKVIKTYDFKSETRKQITTLPESLIKQIYSGGEIAEDPVDEDDKEKYCSFFVRDINNSNENFIPPDSRSKKKTMDDSFNNFIEPDFKRKKKSSFDLYFSPTSI
jgi:hypothetical protein